MPLTALASLRLRRFPFTVWPWRSAAHLAVPLSWAAIGALIVVPYLVALVAGGAGGGGRARSGEKLMAELRELIHGIRPQVLTELGLSAALRELAGHATVPVSLHTDLVRPPGQVEAAGYFVVAEALTNEARHSGATAATVCASTVDSVPVVEVGDDGVGGADPAAGSGLT